jgi:arabinofuranosyltransferase
VLFIAPALAVASRRFDWRTRLRAAAIGLAPIAAWEVFSIVYYGFAFPNTAYAKLQHGIPSGAMVVQGLLYLLDEFAVDPATPIVIGTAAAALVAVGPRRDWPFLIGFILYTAYIVRVGGDFMTGRFFSVAVLVFVAIWARHPWKLPRGAVPVALGLLAVVSVFGSSRPTVTSSSWTFTVSPADAMSVSGIADERAFYYRYTGLLRWSRARTLPWNAQVQRGLELAAAPAIAREVNIGFMGFYAGPRVTIIDEYGLCDPFLARLPATNADWRTGHYYRPSPPGYVESIESGANRLVDPQQARLYEQIRVITRGPVWTVRRWRAILDLALS